MECLDRLTQFRWAVLRRLHHRLDGCVFVLPLKEIERHRKVLPVMHRPHSGANNFDLSGYAEAQHVTRHRAGRGLNCLRAHVNG